MIRKVLGNITLAKVLGNITLAKVLANITLAKVCGAIFSALLITLMKYCIAGGIHIGWEEFYLNFSLGFLGWFIKIISTDLFSDLLNTRGLNINLNNILYGFETQKMGDESILSKSKPKLYCSMESSSDSESKPGKYIDKGKGIDLEAHPNYYGDRGNNDPGVSGNDNDNSNKPLDKGKGIDKTEHPFYEGFKNKKEAEAQKPFAIWSKLNPGLDPMEAFFPKRTNPGPGFNVPGGKVPIGDDICKHIDYNSHILTQFRKMDLETAIQQRDNNWKYIEAINAKVNHAHMTLAKLPPTPTSEYEVRLREKILMDLDNFSKAKIRTEARATLLNSRVEFILIQINKNPDGASKS